MMSHKYVFYLHINMVYKIKYILIQILELINMTVRKNREFLLGVIVYYLGQKATLQSSNYPMNDQKEKIVIIGFYYI